MMARVRGVIAASTRSGSRQYVSSSMSANTGRAPTYSATLADATNVNAGVMTSSPSFTPCARTSRGSAAVPELTATACRTPHQRANSSSNASTTGPCASWPLSRTASTALRSSSPICGAAIGIVFSVSNRRSSYARGQCLDHALGRVAVAEQGRSRRGGPELAHLARDGAAVAPHEHVPPAVHCFGPLGGVPDCDARAARKVRLLLHAAGVGDDDLRALFQDQHLQVADRVDDPHVLGHVPDNASSPGMNREDREHPGGGDAVEDRFQPLGLLGVFGAMNGEQRVTARRQSEVVEDPARPLRRRDPLAKPR